MISFKVLDNENLNSIVNALSENLSENESETLLEIANSLSLGEDEDVELAISVSSGCALIRVFDFGRYFFVFPYELSESADVDAAISEISEYAMREEIGLVFSDVPSSELCRFSGYRHMDLDAEGADAESYRVKIKTECQLCEEIPEQVGERVKLNAIEESDISVYAKLSKDENVNKYWGYNYKEDENEPADEYFFETARRDFSLGSAMSLAIRYEKKFIGEAVLYAFDGKGGAEFAIRLLSEYHGMGLGRETLSVLMKIARRIGLVRVCARVLNENKKSVAMMKFFGEPLNISDEACFFEFPLYS